MASVKLLQVNVIEVSMRNLHCYAKLELSDPNKNANVSNKDNWQIIYFWIERGRLD